MGKQRKIDDRDNAILSVSLPQIHWFYHQHSPVITIVKLLNLRFGMMNSSCGNHRGLYRKCGILAHSAITESHRLGGGFKRKHLLCIALEAGSPGSGCLSGWVLGDGLLPELQMAIFSLYPHMVENKKRGSKLFPPLIKGTDPILEVFTFEAQLPPKGPTS